ncbi:MAG: redoxin domain-containing protein [Vicinamibacterales bacterium]
MSAPAVGTLAPDFELPSHHGGTVRLSGFRGTHHVVIAFHPLAFTPVCATQMQQYERERATLEDLDAKVLGISIDAGPAKAAWADMLGGISFDLLSDFHPHGQVASAYGVMRDDGISQRALFVVGKDGRIAWAKIYEIPEQPDFTELVDVLKALS